MPITQDRMLALLAAAQDYQQAWDRAEAFAQTVQRSLDERRITTQEACAQLLLVLTSQMQLQRPTMTATTIAEERIHFRIFKQRNIRAAERQRLRRGGTQAHINSYLEADRAEVAAETEVTLEMPEYEIGDRLTAEEKARIERELGYKDD